LRELLLLFHPLSVQQFFFFPPCPVALPSTLSPHIVPNPQLHRENHGSSPAMAQPTRLRTAVSGLGRMGARHALHFLHRTPRAHLVAAFSPDPKEFAWAKEHLEPWGVILYTDYEAMLQHEGLQAVVVATATTVHAEQTIKAVEKGLHVLCEKPLSTSLEVVSPFFASKVVRSFLPRFGCDDLTFVRRAVKSSSALKHTPTLK
jgi:hypothetical protein